MSSVNGRKYESGDARTLDKKAVDVPNSTTELAATSLQTFDLSLSMSSELLDGGEEEPRRSEEPTTAIRFKLYQVLLFLVTQMGYFVCAASLLTTTFFKLPEEYCSIHNPISANASATDEVPTQFHSLLSEWGDQCREDSPLTYWVSLALMGGAIFGSFAAGYIADRFGRKPVVTGSLVLICVGNALLAMFAKQWQTSMALFFVVGSASGGYMVTNMVLLVESLSKSSSRLLVISLNGWPIGMIGTALLALYSSHWQPYHTFVAAYALILAIAIQLLALESVPWLQQSNCLHKANQIRQQIARWNTVIAKRSGSDKLLPRKDEAKDDSPSPSLKTSFSDESNLSKATKVHNYTYLDLFRHRLICTRLLALLFCFGTSSVVSFGLYFSVLPGDRYFNMAVMGASKMALGFLPFLVSRWMGRRPIMLVSVGVAAMACWVLILGWLLYGISTHWITTFLGLTITAAIDPTWKVNHLYSIELFPTPIRNMARASCNVVARLGTLSSTLVIVLRSVDALLPFWVFAVLLSAQLVIAAVFLPETRGRPLPEQMPSSRSECTKQRRRNSTVKSASKPLIIINRLDA